MKTLTKSLHAAVLGGIFSVAAIAGPGPQYWNRSASKPAATAETSAKQVKDGAVVSCAHMLVRNTGPGSDRVPWKSVTCTPEMLQTDAVCQRDCGVAPTPSAQTEHAGLTCAHMLMRTTGPHSDRVRFQSVNCTPEMMKDNPECQTACRS